MAALDSLTRLTERMRSATLFAGLPDAEVQRIAAAAHLKQMPAGEYFFLQGDPAERIYLLVEGRLKLSQSAADGQQALLRVIGAGSLFGAVALAQAKEYPVSAQAAADSQAVYWTPLELMEFVKKSPELAINAMKVMAEHVQEFQDRYLQLATERVERRLARTLLRLAAQTGKKTDAGVLIDLPLTRQDLAEMSGTTLFSVSRILNQWEEQGLVAVGRTKVVVVFPHGLVRIAEDLPVKKE
ncbi:transcriptional regulator, Crp/Fnr family [Longilinea arvoryzae]|uniref:Transcriptional regulator, Crp/Fnr family n=1 Tax=Longilinea arvoryzae TaxID=360412 RepID=A0A0S7BH27_9CHLR|nr:Crp/Fnr family transcriptional regulator [Longilinea arvoryzae]GAP13362.1 transcriptional regulator, Crp/Fnr family [Longilinea arvoryzae]